MPLGQFIQEHPYEIATAIVTAYEALARVIPTDGNWTLLYNFVKLLDLFVKNRTTQPNVYLETTSVPIRQEVITDGESKI
jgi:hypothetical protein